MPMIALSVVILLVVLIVAARDRKLTRDFEKHNDPKYRIDQDD